MEGLFDFLANYYIWFAGASIFFAFALIGLVYESKKKKKEENKTADAVAQPITAQDADQPKGEVVVASAQPEQQNVAAPAPSLEGLEGNTNNFENLNESMQPQTLVIDDKGATPADGQAPSAEPTLVIEDTPAPSAEPTLVIEDPSAQPAPEAAAATPAPEATPAAPATLGNPGQPPV
jgi:hypothetical protein